MIPARTHIWGLDLSNTAQGAGGVGGLLATREGTGTGGEIRYYTCDGNGNISEVLDATGEAQAHYEYDPFGNTTVATGLWANTNEWRFSTKPFDAASGLYYYGYRFYDPVFGRWPNRDPIEEEGGVNLYQFMNNNAIDFIDYRGLWKEPARKKTNNWATIEAETGDTWEGLAKKLKLNVEQVNKWVKNYDNSAAPTPCEKYEIPNTFVLWSGPFKRGPQAWADIVIMDNVGQRVYNRIKNKIAGYKIEKKKYSKDGTTIGQFNTDWNTDGIYGIMMLGHHAEGVGFVLKFYARGYPEHPTTLGGQIVHYISGGVPADMGIPSNVKPSYKLGLIAAVGCSTASVNKISGEISSPWLQHLSTDGKFLGFKNEVGISKFNSILVTNE